MTVLRNTASPATTAVRRSGNRTAFPMKIPASARTVLMPTTTAANPAGRSFRKASSAGTATCPTAKDASTSLKTRSRNTVTSPHPFSTETESDTLAWNWKWMKAARTTTTPPASKASPMCMRKTFTSSRMATWRTVLRSSLIP